MLFITVGREGQLAYGFFPERTGGDNRVIGFMYLAKLEGRGNNAMRIGIAGE